MGSFLNKTNNPLMKINGEFRLPIAHINCNFLPPGKDNISLMTFSEIKTFFHEFGHAL